MKTLRQLRPIFIFAIALFTSSTAISQEIMAQDTLEPSLAPSSAKPPERIAVYSNDLKEIGLWGLGADDDGFSPIESDLWKNSRPENLNLLFDKLSLPTKFVPINNLVQRAVFSGGQSPQNNSNANNDASKKRLAAAARIGESAKVAQILSRVPQISQSQYLLSSYADSLFAIGKNDEACAAIDEAKPDAPIRQLLELRAVCYALNGESAAAQLSLELASAMQTKSQSDQWLARAILAVGENNSNVSQLKFRADNGIYYALSKKLALNMDTLLAQNVSLGNLAALAKSPIPIQEQLIKNAQKSGVLSMNEYRELKPDNITAAAPNLGISADSTGNIAIVDFDGDDFGKELLGALDIDDWWIIAKRIGPKLAEIANPNPQFIAAYIDAALANSDIDTARKFMAKSQVTQPYRNIIMAIIDPKLAAPIIRDAINGPFANNYPKAKVIADLSLYWALSQSESGQEALIDTNGAGGTQLPQNLMFALESAVNRGAKGEIILTSALALQAIDAKAVDLTQMARITRALKTAGLENDAKELAIYSILARRLDFGRGIVRNNSISASQKSNNSAANSTQMTAPIIATSPAIEQRAPNPPRATPRTTPSKQAPIVPDWRGKVD